MLAAKLMWSNNYCLKLKSPIAIKQTGHLQILIYLLDPNWWFWFRCCKWFIPCALNIPFRSQLVVLVQVVQVVYTIYFQYTFQITIGGFGSGATSALYHVLTIYLLDHNWWFWFRCCKWSIYTMCSQYTFQITIGGSGSGAARTLYHVLSIYLLDHNCWFWFRCCKCSIPCALSNSSSLYKTVSNLIFITYRGIHENVSGDVVLAVCVQRDRYIVLVHLYSVYDRPRPRQCECHPGTNFWHPPIEVTRGAVLAPVFCKAKKD